MKWWKHYRTLAEIPSEHSQSYLPIPAAAKLATVHKRLLREAVAKGKLQRILLPFPKIRPQLMMEHGDGSFALEKSSKGSRPGAYPMEYPYIRVDHLRAFLEAKTTFAKVASAQ